MRLIVIVVGLTMSLVFSSCVVHDSFPFICFLPSCVNKQHPIKAFKKRMNAKMKMAKRKRNRGKSGTEQNYARRKPDLNGMETDSLSFAMGNNVDYFRYLIFFRLKSDPKALDSLLVTHTSAYKTLIAVDQTRLSYMIDTIGIKNIIMVYLKEYYDTTLIRNEHQQVTKARIHAVKKCILKMGVPAGKVKKF